MKRTLSFIIIFFIMIIIGTSSVFALESLKIDIIPSNKNAKVDDTIDVTIGWSHPMQAADYTINYDSSKLQFISGNISETFYNNIEPGKVIVTWLDLSGEDTLSSMVFKFKVIADGDADISVKVDAFATENLETPSNFDTQPVTMTLLSQSTDDDDIKSTPIPTTTPTPTEKPSNETTTKPNTNISTDSDKKQNVVQIESQEDKSLTNNKIPYAGTSERVIIFITIISIISIILMIKLKNLRDVE